MAFGDVSRDRPCRARDLPADLEAILSRNRQQNLTNLAPDLHAGLPDFEIAMTSNDVGHSPTIAGGIKSSATIRTRPKPSTLDPRPFTSVATPRAPPP